MRAPRRLRLIVTVLSLVAALLVALPNPAGAGTLTSAAWTTATPFIGAPQSSYNYGFTTATTATLGSVTASVPGGTTASNRYLDLNGATHNEATTPDSVSNSLTSALDIRVHVAMADWTPAASQVLMAKDQVAGHVSWKFYVLSNGQPEFDWSQDGSDTTSGVDFTGTASGVAPSVSDGQALWLRVTWVQNNGSSHPEAKFYTSPDGTTWTQLGSTRTFSTLSSSGWPIYDSDSEIEVGSRRAGVSVSNQKSYYADIRNALQGTTSASGCTTTAVVSCFNPSDDLPGSTTWSSSDTQQEAWTLSRSGTNLPADIATDLTVSANSGIGAGTAKLRQLDELIYYTVTSPTSIPASTVISLTIGGITNGRKRGNLTSTITTYDTTPTAIDTATTGSLLFINPVSVGASECQILLNGTPQCWGRNEYGQVGDNTSSGEAQPVNLSGGPYAFSDISQGGYNACGLSTAGAGYCWGLNWAGGVGDNSTTNRSAPTAVTGSHTFAEISAGNVASCGVTTAGAGYCWGNNGNGGVGDGTTTNRPAPVLISGYTFSEIVASSGNWTCGLTTTGAAYCWGADSGGQVGNGTSGSDVLSPSAVSGGLTFVDIAVGGTSSCALTPAGAAYCWGSNGSGQIGNGVTGGTYVTPQLVTTTQTFVNITVGNNNACATNTSGVQYCWGINSLGEVGDGTSANRSVPTAVSSGSGILVSSAGNDSVCGITATAAVSCWGNDSADELGSATIPINAAPVAVSNGLSFAQISVGTQFACGVTTSNAGYCWGNNNSGELGQGNNTTYTAPQAVSGTWSSITAGNAYACGVTTTNHGYCWGTNGNGQLGDGTTGSHTSPNLVGADAYSWNTIVAGGTSTCGITTSNDAYCWGAGTNGQLGTGDGASHLSPTIVANSLKWGSISVSAGGLEACGVTTVATSSVGYCWGANTGSQVGNGNNSQQNSPAIVSGSLSWAYIGSGGAGSTAGSTCGVTTSGVAYCWGANTAGALGSGDFSSYNTPHAVTGSLTLNTTTSSLSSGMYHNCGITTSNTAYCWGYNGSGKLGDNTTSSRNSPVAAFGSNTFSSISAGSYATCAIATSAHAAYCWGNNSYGNLGNGASSMSLVPEFLDNAPVAASITQTKSDSSVVAANGYTNESSINLSATLTDQDTEKSDTVKLCIEVEPVGTAFTDNATCTSLASNPSTATYTPSGFSDSTSYHWQYRTSDSEGGYSVWTAYNGGGTGFGVDEDAPTLGTASLSTTTSLSALSGNWTSSPGYSGLQSYSYALGTTSGGSDLIGWTADGTATSVSLSGLTLRTTQPYYLSVQATDNAGNTSTFTSPATDVAPSATFSSTTPAIMYIPQGGSGTVSFTVTAATNAYNGFKVSASLPSALTYHSSTIANVSGTWTAPEATGSSGNGFGYTSSDTSVSGSNRFQSSTCPGGGSLTGAGCYAAFNSSTPGDVVADDTGPVTGTPISRTFTITLYVSVPANQAGGFYTSQIVLTPVFAY